MWLLIHIEPGFGWSWNGFGVLHGIMPFHLLQNDIVIYHHRVNSKSLDNHQYNTVIRKIRYHHIVRGVFVCGWWGWGWWGWFFENPESCVFAELELLSYRKPKRVVQNEKNAHTSPNIVTTVMMKIHVPMSVLSVFSNASEFNEWLFQCFTFGKSRRNYKMTLIR